MVENRHTTPLPQGHLQPEPILENHYKPPQAQVQDMAVQPEEFATIRLWSSVGRIGRLRFLARLVGFVILGLMISNLGILFAVALSKEIFVYWVIGGFLLPVFYLFFCTTAQRLHDMGYSAWFALLNFIPYLNFLICLGLICIPGKKNSNTYGPPAPPNSTAVRIVGIIAIMLIFILTMNVLIALVTESA